MGTNTTRLGLFKPASSDNVNVLTDLNNNYDKIDAHLGNFICTSSTRPTGVDRFTGRTIFETDTKQWLMWDGSAWEYSGGAFQSTWSLAVTGATSGTAVVGNGVVNANYMRIGHWVEFWLRFTLGTTTSFAPAVGSLAFSLPPIASTMGNTTVFGTGFISDSSSGDRYVIAVAQETTTTVTLPLTRAAGAIVSDAIPWSWANGDTIRFSGKYKVT